MNRGHLLVRTNLHVKYEDLEMYGFQDNQRKSSGLLTDISKTIYPLFFEGRHKMQAYKNFKARNSMRPLENDDDAEYLCHITTIYPKIKCTDNLSSPGF